MLFDFTENEKKEVKKEVKKTRFLDISNKEYHENKAMGSTMLSMMLQNAKKAKMIMDGDYKMNFKALKIGSALHKIVLEKESFDDEFIVGNLRVSDRIKELAEFANKKGYNLYPYEVLTPSGGLSSSKKAKEILTTLDDNIIYLTPNEEKELSQLNKAKDKEILSYDDYTEIIELKDKILSLPKLKEWIKAGVSEKSFFGEIDGVKVKCRPDLLVKTKSGYIVIDLKTTGKEATSEEFAKSSASFLYPLQEALYKEVLRQNGIYVEKFIFAVVSKLEYSSAGYFEHDITAKEFGAEILKKAIFKYKWCLKNEEFEEGNFDFVYGGFTAINEVVLPNYIYYKY